MWSGWGNSKIGTIAFPRHCELFNSNFCKYNYCVIVYYVLLFLLYIFCLHIYNDNRCTWLLSHSLQILAIHARRDLQFRCAQYKQMLYLELVLAYGEQHLNHVLDTRRDLPWVQHSSECLKHGHGPRTITDFHSKQLIIGNASCDLHGVDLVILLIRLKCTIRIITREVKHCVVTNPFNSRLDVANGWVNFQNSKYQACMAWELYMCVHACTAPTFLSAHKHEKFCNIIIRTHCIPS